MTSLRQIAANRRNALRSTGPTTPEGKERSRLNAVRHGLAAETVIATLEDADDYQAFEAAVIADYDAETAVERELVLRLASVLWRLRRATGIEADLFESVTAEPARLEPSYSSPTLIGGADVPDSDRQRITAAPGQSGEISEPALNRNNDIGGVFLRLAELPTFPLDRLNRYEHLLWRQARQLVFTLESLRRRKRQPSYSNFPFSLRTGRR